jgi:hypothetical protein
LGLFGIALLGFPKIAIARILKILEICGASAGRFDGFIRSPAYIWNIRFVGAVAIIMFVLMTWMVIRNW